MQSYLHTNDDPPPIKSIFIEVTVVNNNGHKIKTFLYSRLQQSGQINLNVQQRTSNLFSVKRHESGDIMDVGNCLDWVDHVVRCHYNAFSPIWNFNKKHPTGRTWGLNIGCLLWAQGLICGLPPPLQCCIEHRDILDHVIKAHDSINKDCL